MKMSDLLIKAGAPDKDGCIAAVSPESAGWKYVGFEVYQLQAGATLTRDSGGTRSVWCCWQGRLIFKWMANGSQVSADACRSLKIWLLTLYMFPPDLIMKLLH